MTFSSKTDNSKAIGKKFDKFGYVIMKCFAEKTTRNKIKIKAQ